MALSHLNTVCREWIAVRSARAIKTPVSITGGSLTIADVVAVALHGVSARLTNDKAVHKRIAASVDFLAAELAAGKVIYGVNTGFGGSADTRTQDFHRLQSALVQHLNVGILLPGDKGQKPSPILADRANVDDLLLRSHALPVSIVRALMLVRGNSLARGHSAVRAQIIESLLHLLTADMTPVVPLRGSISASGDLSTLSYVAGTLEGNPDVHVRCVNHEEDGGSGGRVFYLSADKALQAAGLAPIRLQAKEGLGITNGTAPSCAAACLAVHTANQMAVLTQLLTAMGTEALAGNAHNYDAFISGVRPHAGQSEAAANIQRFLAGSVLSPAKTPDRVGLAQDRYALRTAPQWIGPQLEDLALATQQVATELNATTDNPLVDAGDASAGRLGTVHHGGNFQAMAVTSAMEKTLMALQNLGRLIYAQSTELIDNSRNHGLPPNLSPDDPSTSFLCKGFDVNMAAYQAELAYLAHPVSSHVQMAEMANQMVNSMALVAARYALEAGELVGLMAATYIFTLCQALDLRCIQRLFRDAVVSNLPAVLYELFGHDGKSDETAKTAVDGLAAHVVPRLLARWDDLAHLDLIPRGEAAARDTTGAILAHCTAHPSSMPLPSGAALLAFQTKAAACLSQAYDDSRSRFSADPAQATLYLAPASRVVYEFVRRDLNIPFHRGIDDHPTLAAERRSAAPGKTDEMNGRQAGGSPLPGGEDGVGPSSANGRYANGHAHGRTNGTPDGGRHAGRGDDEAHGRRILGTMASEIYMALRDGRLFDRVVEFCGTDF